MQVLVAKLRQVIFILSLHFSLTERLLNSVHVLISKCYISRIMDLSSRHYHIYLEQIIFLYSMSSTILEIQEVVDS